MGELEQDKCRKLQWQISTATKNRQGIHKCPSIIYPSQCQDRGKGGFCIDVPMVPELWALIQSHIGTHNMFRGIQLIHCRLQGDPEFLFFCLLNVLVPAWSACMIIVFYIELYWTIMLTDMTADACNQGLNPTVPCSSFGGAQLS